jgi:hypothetical protein
MIPNLQVGQKRTLVWIDDVMALTHRQEIEIRSVIEPIKVGYEGRNTCVGTYRVRGKRKDFFLDLKPDTLVFDGWNVPLRLGSNPTASTPIVLNGSATKMVKRRLIVPGSTGSNELSAMVR